MDSMMNYLLSGQSCIPGISKDLQTVFEEQFYAPNLEDAVAIAGRADVRVFSEADQTLSFGPVLAKGASDDGEGGITERIRISNPFAIPCTVQLAINPEPGAVDVSLGGKAGGERPAWFADDDVGVTELSGVNHCALKASKEADRRFRTKTFS